MKIKGGFIFFSFILILIPRINFAGFIINLSDRSCKIEVLAENNEAITGVITNNEAITGVITKDTLPSGFILDKRAHSGKKIRCSCIENGKVHSLEKILPPDSISFLKTEEEGFIFNRRTEITLETKSFDSFGIPNETLEWLLSKNALSPSFIRPLLFSNQPIEELSNNIIITLIEQFITFVNEVIEELYFLEGRQDSPALKATRQRLEEGIRSLRDNYRSVHREGRNELKNFDLDNIYKSDLDLDNIYKSALKDTWVILDFLNVLSDKQLKILHWSRNKNWSIPKDFMGWKNGQFNNYSIFHKIRARKALSEMETQLEGLGFCFRMPIDLPCDSVNGIGRRRNIILATITRLAKLGYIREGSCELEKFTFSSCERDLELVSRAVRVLAYGALKIGDMQAVQRFVNRCRTGEGRKERRFDTVLAIVNKMLMEGRFDDASEFGIENSKSKDQIAELLELLSSKSTKKRLYLEMTVKIIQHAKSEGLKPALEAIRDCLVRQNNEQILMNRIDQFLTLREPSDRDRSNFYEWLRKLLDGNSFLYD